MTEAVVLFDEINTVGGHRFGVATLNEPRSLNALSAPMAQLLTPQLRAWAADDGIAGVLLQGSGDKAFCAGGDLHTIYKSCVEHGAARNRYAEDYFCAEYELDHLIHTYAKPMLCWGHGIVLGGGIGLMAGASQRVVTAQSRLAMPEISIGFYPDVGASWFLRRMPRRVGLFLALTAAPLNAADAIFCGLADICIAQAHKAQVLEDIGRARWQGEARADRAMLSRLLELHAASAELQRSPLRSHFDTINALMAGDDLLEIAQRLRSLESEDPWLHAAAASFAKGSPTSIALAFELWQRVHHMSLAEVFRLEYWASLGCCAHADFREGVRALLIDKDKNPRWNPPSLEQVTREQIEDYLRPRADGPHPLAALA